MRLIDADDVGNSMDIKWQKALVKAEIDSTPTINPETLSIVQELKEQLAKVTAERDAAVEDLKLIFNAGRNCRICAKTNYCIDKDFVIGKCSKFLWRGI